MSRPKKPADAAEPTTAADAVVIPVTETPGASDDAVPVNDAAPIADATSTPAIDAEAAPIADLAPVDPPMPVAEDITPSAIAAALGEGTPNADLVEAVRRVLAGEVVPAPARPAATRLGHTVLMDLDHDGESHPPYSIVFVTEAEFDQLKEARVFRGFWDEGVEEA